MGAVILGSLLCGSLKYEQSSSFTLLTCTIHQCLHNSASLWASTTAHFPWHQLLLQTRHQEWKMDKEIGFASASYARQKNRKEEGKEKPSSLSGCLLLERGANMSLFISLGRRELRGRAGAGAKTLCGRGSLLTSGWNYCCTALPMPPTFPACRDRTKPHEMECN